MMASRREKIKALSERPGTDGEGQAAVAALSRLPAAPIERNRLTDAMVRNLPLPARGQKIHYDVANRKGNDYVAGFGVRVTAGGARTFVLNYRSKAGREGRAKIGAFGVLSVEAARLEAKQLMARVLLGEDPAKDDREKRQADNVNQLCDEFLEAHVSHKRSATAAEYRAIIKKYVRPALGTTKVADVQPLDIDRLHRKISTNAPYRANRCVAILSKMFNLSIRWKMRDDNPCEGVERNEEHNRERRLTEGELARLHATLDAYKDQKAADAVRLLLFTGARPNEVLKATRSQFASLGDGLWIKPSSHTKQKKLHRVVLNTPALDLWRKVVGRTDADNVFDGLTLRQLRGHWSALMTAAGIADLRPYDLRHNFGSTLDKDGATLPTIGKLMGHVKTSTTQKYVHPDDESQQRATEAAGERFTPKNHR